LPPAITVNRDARLKILHAILSSGFHGSERYCIDLAIAQAQSGHQVIVVVADAGSEVAEQYRDAIASAGGGGTDAATPALIALPPGIPAWLQRPAAAIVLGRHRPDIVHTHLNPAARRIGTVAQRFGVAHVLTLHLGYDPREHASIDGLVALHTKQREQIPPDFPGAVTIIWNWLPSRVAAAIAQVRAADVERLRAGWGADDGTFVFGSVGRLMPEKGMDVLIRAFREAFPAGEAKVRLIIAGEGAQRGELERLAAGDDRIRLIGTQAEIAPYYRAFDAFVSAARFEPFGLAIIEAMGAGCPLIATRIHGTLEFATDPRVLWADPDCPDELGLQLRAAASRGRVRFAYDMAPFTLARAAAEMEAFYRSVIARR
jgi:glycosyltransferase involved in cell wall biosynthesis